MLKRKGQYLFLVFILLALLTTGCGVPVANEVAVTPLDPYVEPVQITCSNPQSGRMAFTDAEFNIVPLAEYHITAKVMSKAYYWFGWESKLSPVDLALAWGKLIEPGYDKYISYSQSGRWYFYRYKAGCPVDGRYISSHSSNHHIIPANDNIKNAIVGVRKKQIIAMEGFLVSVKGTYRGARCWWNSSLTRMDTGNGACELFYVNQVRINNAIYR